MTDLIRVVVGGSVAALAATLLFVNAALTSDTDRRPATEASVSATEAAPMLPRRARLVRLPDRGEENAAPDMYRVSWGQTAGLLALLGLSSLWLAGRRRRRVETA
jgi:hypothetical protein